MEFNEDIILNLKDKLNINEKYIKAVLELLSNGATVPFIARYRKEATNGLNEDEIRQIEHEFNYQQDLLKKKENIIKLISEKGLLDDALLAKINEAKKLVELDDLYLPFKEKKKTKASRAYSLGLLPLAKLIMTCPAVGDINKMVTPHLNEELRSIDEALVEASYIVCELISENAIYRKKLRDSLFNYGMIESKKKQDAIDLEYQFENYYDYSERISKIKPHRVLAINRGEDLKVLNVSLKSSEESDLEYLERNVIFRPTLFKDILKSAIKDSYKRLIFPSISREVRNELTEIASKGAIEVFSMNLKNLLLAAPIKGKTVLGVDPAFRTGCKLAVVDETGRLLEIGVIYPNEREKGKKVDEADLISSEKTTLNLIKKYNVDLITIGNGTASRETEEFISNLISKNHLDIKYAIVSEAGASVYSASSLAKEEFPDLTLEKRSAVSIARRIQDPLAELVKIDPKAIGVGQYQHDVNQHDLEESLNFVVEEAVNKVGIDLNTASKSLLTYISGLNKTTASNIVEYRNEIGKFKSRSELKNVKKLGDKTYQMAVGFLRIPDGTEPLDKTGIHPESYGATRKILKHLSLDIKEMGNIEFKDKLNNLNMDELKDLTGLDSFTLKDIIEELKEPLRDYRDDAPKPKLLSTKRSLEDINVGDILEGIVRNVVDFGAFIDCGLHDDGLLHISKMSKSYVKHPKDLLKVGDLVKVKVIDIDLKKRKLAFSMILDN